MARTYAVNGIDNLPVFLVSASQPRVISEDELISGVPLPDVLRGLAPGEQLYLVDLTSTPGQTRLVRLT